MELPEHKGQNDLEIKDDELTRRETLSNAFVEQNLIEKLPRHGEGEDFKGCFHVDFYEFVGREELELGRWFQVSPTVYGYCIAYLTMHHCSNRPREICSYLLRKILPCVAVASIQGGLLYNLYYTNLKIY